MTDRPFGLTPADHPGITVELALRREAFVREWMRARGLGDDPARLTVEQIEELRGEEGYPR